MAMTLRLSEAETAALRATAEREGRSMHAVAVEAIRSYTDTRRQRRDELLTRIVRDRAEALDRLANS